MMRKSRGMLAVLIPGLILGALTCGSVFAADPKSNAQVFATVDVEQAFNNYDKKKDLESKLMALYDQAKQRLDLRTSTKLLSTDEFAELANLKTKPNRNDADSKRIEELTNLSKQRDQEFQGLQQKQNATDDDKRRLAMLQDQITKSDQSYKDEETKAEADLNKQRVDLSTQLMQEVNAAVASVAKEKGISMVFNKSTDAPTLVIYSNYDITEEVIKKLNKK